MNPTTTSTTSTTPCISTATALYENRVGGFWPSPLPETPWALGIRIPSPHKSGVGKIWPSPVLGMSSVIGVSVSGQRLCRLGHDVS